MTRSLVAGGPGVDDLAGKVRGVQASGIGPVAGDRGDALVEIDTRPVRTMIEPA
ncbi:hypothetical protein [Pseudonocardia sp.]|jgi:hypothetical protein|uniref:hypothetical protein n=1 Tax=Pseudonocardia sp. TaxID=60912 RepID=UPI0031FDA1B1